MLKIGRQGWQFLSIIHLKLKIHQTAMEFEQIPKSDFKKPLLNDKIPSQEPFAGYSINAPKTTILFFYQNRIFIYCYRCFVVEEAFPL